MILRTGRIRVVERRGSILLLGMYFPLDLLFLYYRASIYGAMLTIGEQNRWDPVTGLGTPNFPKLLDVFLNLP